MKRLAVLTLLGWVGLTACYAYQPAAVVDLQPRQTVRMRLAPGEATRLAEYVRAESRTMDGTFLEQNPDSLLMLVTSFSELQGDRVQTFQQRVQVSRGEILDLEMKSLDRQRTYLVVGVTTAVAVFVAIDKLRGRSGSETQQPNPTPNDSRISRFLLRIPIGP